MVLCSITIQEITVALHTNESCGMLNQITEKRYVITVSENKNRCIF